MLYQNDYSKTREGARNHSRSAVYHSFINQSTGPLFNGQASLGAPGVEQSTIGFNYPTVQAALEDLSNMVTPVNGILMTEFDDNPSGQSQIDLLTVTGVASEDYVYLFGLKIAVSPGDEASVVTTKMINELNIHAANNELLLSVQQIDATSFEIEYIDMRPHATLSFNQNGITVNSVIQTQVRPGFGTWTQLGTTEIVTGKTVYVWKRTS